MTLTAIAGPLLCLPLPSRRISLTTTSAAAASSQATPLPTEPHPPPREFHYPRADPSVRWPHLKIEELSDVPQFSAASSSLPHSLPEEPDRDSDPPEDTETDSFETIDSKQSRTRAKKMTKLALKRARDWRQRVQFLADRILALAPSAHVADVLDRRGVQMTPTDLAFVVRTVGRSSWNRALEVFEWLTLRRRHAPSPRLLAIIISILGRAHQDALAAEVFQLSFPDEATDISVQVYNAMMGVYARTGKFTKVQELLGLMRDRGLEPDLVSFNTLINAKAKARALSPGSALELLQEVRRSGLRPDAITYNTLISACSLVSNLGDAVKIFKDMETSRCQPDLWTYNAMISVFGRCGMTMEAERLFRELGARGFLPDAVTYNSLLFAFAKDGDEEKVEKLCEEMVGSGFKKDEITYNTIIHMYGKQSRFDLVVRFYDEMKNVGCNPDAVTYTVLIDSLGKANRITEAGQVMEEMLNAGVRPTLRTFSALICAYAKAGMRAEAVHAFDHMVKVGIKPDHLAYSVMLDVLLRSNELRKAMVLYRGMMQDGFRPDQGLYQSMLEVFSKEVDNEKINEIVKDMEEVSMMNPQVIAALLVKGGCFIQGAEMLKKAISYGYEPDRQCLLSILSAFAASQRQAESMALLKLLRENSPNSHCLITESSIIMHCKNLQLEDAMMEYNNTRTSSFGHCSHTVSLYECMIMSFEEAELFWEASQLFSDMKVIGLEPSQDIYKSMISTYCKLGFPETAHNVFDHAARAGILLPDTSVYVTLIETYGKLKLWQKAESFARELRLQCKIDRNVWNALINAYAESGLYEQARAIFDMMMKNGPSPNVDSINGLMRSLVVDDRLNELFVVVEDLQDLNFKISKSTIMIMLDAFTRAGNIFEVKKIYNGMKASGYFPTMNIYTSMLTLLSRGKRVKDVEAILAEMEEAGFKPDLTIFNLLLKMYTSIEDFRKTLEIYKLIKDSEFEMNEDTYNTLIMMYSKDLRPEEGFSLLNEMKKKGLVPKLDAYKSLLAACCKDQLWEQADELFESMRPKGYKLDRAFYHIMMKIYRNSGNHSKAESLLFQMKEDGVKPTIATMHLLMVSYGSAGQPQEAEKVLTSLKNSGQELSTLPYCSVIDGYFKVGDYNMGIAKFLEMKKDGVEPDHKIWTCFIRAASLCKQTNDAILLLNALGNNGFDLPLRILSGKDQSAIMDLENLLEESKSLGEDASFNFVNAMEDLLWAFERRATASWIFQLAIRKNIYRHDIFRVAEKDWGADFRKLSPGAALVGLTLWLDHMQDASLQGSPESPKSVLLITGTAEYNLVSLEKTVKAYLWEMGSPFLPSRTRTGIMVAKAHSLRMWLKDSCFCLDLELKDGSSLPETNSMKLTEGYFMRVGLLPTFKHIHERLGQIRPKKFARLALLSEESREKIMNTDLQGRKEKMEKMKAKGIPRSRKLNRFQMKYLRRQHKSPAALN
ncbi:pentatricopeptide repeat-containing protein At3g18110, chloroplastic-like [Zingiber officinale]|uniref:PROP1-like PPR domain-containing protein n=1 Tax=Zingiber officinale TaxID=94328 RepID=A0A8J5L3I5_ZINOF|nr:pentatricopeptide repeat-containing protein At3g18110, chloroplastic-like [Zingiber officinale]KAG6499315.1 hypothetical protein ZIOFF_039079 [Zingiber officinale]